MSLEFRLRCRSDADSKFSLKLRLCYYHFLYELNIILSTYKVTIMSGNKLVFISHITEEAELARIFSEEIKSAYLGLLDTFVSSDGESLPAGGRWLDKIDQALSDSAIQISLCSPESVKRPWINFEAGASWIRRIPVVPICHSGLSKSGLPVPLSMLQAADATNETDLRIMFSELSKVLGAKISPNVDYTGLIQKVSAFIQNYSYYGKIREAVYTACNAEPALKELFLSGSIQSMRVEVADYLFVTVAPALIKLRDLGLVNFEFPGTKMTPDGVFRVGNITITPKYLTEALPRMNKP